MIRIRNYISFLFLLIFAVSNAQAACVNPPIKNVRTAEYYSSIQTAYAVAVEGDIFHIQATTISESLALDTISVSLIGGYDCDHLTVSGNTVVDGNMSIIAGISEFGNMIFLKPELTDMSLDGTSPDYQTSADLIANYTLSGTATTAATAWYRNGMPAMTLYMPFEGGEANALFDFSGNLNDGTKGAGAAWDQSIGYDGHGAFEFNGSDNAWINAGAIMPTGAYTKTAWVNRKGSGNNNIISGNSSHAFWVPDDWGYKLAAGHNDNWDYVKDSVALALDTWYFVAVTYDPNVNSGEMILYKNGEEVDSATGVPLQDPAGNSILIGAYKTSNSFTGTIDDVSVYDHALTPDQFLSLHNNGQNIIASSETSVGSTWQAYVTPFSPNGAGETYASPVTTVQGITAASLDYIEIVGPVSINKNSSADYNCTAYYTDSQSQDVEPYAWQIDCPTIADISATGVFTAFEVNADELCTITAYYSENGIARSDDFDLTITQSIAIMPLGDSITYGTASTNAAGYRWDLYNQLVNAGHHINFTGTQNDGPGSMDTDHEGHSGWHANQIRDNIYNWLETNTSDIILLHIGTNDINNYQDAAGVVAEVEQILDSIDQFETDYSRNITVFLAKIINRRNLLHQRGLITSEYNTGLQTMADARITSGDKIIVLDQENAIIYPDDLYDNLHPNDVGYSKMADTWFAPLNLFLSSP